MIIAIGKENSEEERNVLSCEVIKDLLPLYYDGVCTPDSFSLAHEHLQRCEKCRKCLSKITQAEQTSDILFSRSVELRKAAYLCSLKRSIDRRLVASAIAGFLPAFVVCIVLIIRALC